MYYLIQSQTVQFNVLALTFVALVVDVTMSNYFDDDVEDYEQTCPACGHYPLRIADCTNIGCEEGYLDEFHDDPINFPAD